MQAQCSYQFHEEYKNNALYLETGQTQSTYSGLRVTLASTCVRSGLTRGAEAWNLP